METQTQTELITQLRAQHITLMRHFEHALTHSKHLTHSNISRIKDVLTALSHDLHDHLALENDVLYPRYLERIPKPCEHRQAIEHFITEMRVTERSIAQFLHTYRTEARILEDRNKFRNDLGAIFLQFCRRVEIENDEVYDRYLLM